jgi:aspartyl-tRNA(Asn)/glutamyl-tRNA(Gln) amidotransferase subunit A
MLHALTDLHGLSTALKNRERTVSEVIEACLARIKETAHLNAFVTIHKTRARDAAARMDKHLRAALPPSAAFFTAVPPAQSSPFWGVPLAIKDNIDEKDVVCSVGSRAYSDRIAPKDAAVVQRLRRAGAIIVGRTNMHELADGVTSENPFYGPVHNPHRAGYHPGGSSGGSAAAVAAGCLPAALGTDTGGSVRIPAALCGIVGFKPTQGLISTQGIFPLSPTLDHVGWLTRDVFGAAALFSLFTDLPPGAPPSLPEHRTTLRLGVVHGFGREPEPAVQTLFEGACKTFADKGHILCHLELPELARAVSILAAIYGPEAARIHAEKLAVASKQFGPQARKNLERGRNRPPQKHAVALERKRKLQRTLQKQMAKHQLDFLLTPTTPHPARPFGSPDPHTYLTYTCPFNLSGQPALSMPMGCVDGLPVGMQIVGQTHADRTVLALGAAFEKARQIVDTETNLGNDAGNEAGSDTP